MGQVTRIAHLDVEIDIKEIRVPMAHVDAHDIAAGFADHRAGLAQNAGAVVDGGPKAAFGDGVAFGLRRPVQVLP